MADNIKTQEQHHLDHVIDEIHVSQKDLEKKIKATKRDVKDINRNFNNDVRLKTETYSGMMETAMSIRQQQQMLSERENRQEHAARELGSSTSLRRTLILHGLISVRATRSVTKPFILEWRHLPTSRIII